MLCIYPRGTCELSLYNQCLVNQASCRIDKDNQFLCRQKCAISNGYFLEIGYVWWYNEYVLLFPLIGNITVYETQIPFQTSILALKQ